jgi:hypothetical protein
MKPPTFRPTFERLEDRWTPAGNVTASFSALTGTLTITGDAFGNAVDISQTSFKSFNVTGTATTITKGAATFPAGTPVNFANVTNIVMNMGYGNDTVTFGLQTAGPILIAGNLTINGSTGNNTVETAIIPNSLTVIGNMSITNLGGNDSNILNEINVGHALTINNGDGDTDNEVADQQAGGGTLGSLSITNGAGFDQDNIEGVNVTGAVVINDGTERFSDELGDEVAFLPDGQTTPLKLGSLSITNASGQVSINIFNDYNISGNVTIHYGSGGQIAGFVFFDSFSQEDLPVTVKGSVNISPGVAAAPNGFVTIFVGGAFGTNIQGNLTIAAPSNAQNTIQLGGALAIGGATSITTGAGNDQITIEDTVFTGAFTLNTGAGNDTVTLDVFGLPATTDFLNSVNINLGDGNDSLQVGNNSANNAVNFFAPSFLPVTISGGNGIDTLQLRNDFSSTPGRASFVNFEIFV